MNVAAGMWAFRARAEAEAAARFGALSDALARSEVGAPLAAACRRAARDEERHRVQCAALTERFGGAVPDRPVRVSLPGDRGLPDEIRLAHGLIATCCVAETMSAVMLGEMHLRTTDPVVKPVVHAILRDEVDHARLGWAFLARDPGEGARTHLAARLPEILDGALTEELFGVGPDPLAEVEDRGGLSRGRRWELAREALSGVILPGLTRAGIDTSGGERWFADRFAVALSSSAGGPPPR